MDMKVRSNKINQVLFFIDAIEQARWPKTETGYGLLYTAWSMAQQSLGRNVSTRIFMAQQGDCLLGHRVQCLMIRMFTQVPYDYFSDENHIGSCCHTVATSVVMDIRTFDVIVWRREKSMQGSGVHLMLEKLAQIEKKNPNIVFLNSPTSILTSKNSKEIPKDIGTMHYPLSFETVQIVGSAMQKVDASLDFVKERLQQPKTFVVKPHQGDNGKGVTLFGDYPVGARDFPVIDAKKYVEHLLYMLDQYGNLIIQEYLPSLRFPQALKHLHPAEAAWKHQTYGEVRFLLLNGELLKDNKGQCLSIALRCPNDKSYLSDSGTSYRTNLTEQEQYFLEHYVGPYYKSNKILLGGGDLIRTADPVRPFLFTDAAQAICGHVVVTGALNGNPYLITQIIMEYCYELASFETNV